MRKDKKVLAGEDYYRQMDLPLKIQLCRDRQVYWHRHRDFYELVIFLEEHRKEYTRFIMTGEE